MAHAKAMVGALANVHLHDIATNDASAARSWADVPGRRGTSRHCWTGAIMLGVANSAVRSR